MKNVLFLIFSLWFSVSFCQKKEQIEILNAEYLESAVRGGKNAQKLVGNVKFRHQNALMYCDSAFYYSESNSIDAYGSVRINQSDTMDLYGDKLNYVGNEGLAIVSGKEVRLVTKKFTLTTDLLYYYRSLGKAYYKTGGKIVSSTDDNVLTSKIGYYFMNRSVFTFRKNVKLTNSKFRVNSDSMEYSAGAKRVKFYGSTKIEDDSSLIYCERGYYNTRTDQSKFYRNAYLISDGRKVSGDTLYYDKKRGYGKVIGNVKILDTANNVTVSGDYSEIYEKNDSAVVSRNCLLSQIFDEDTLFVAADTFKFVTNKNRGKMLFAYYKVKIFKSDLQGKCDSISYALSDSIVELHKNPILWSAENQLTADSISLYIKDQKINSIYMDNNAFIISEVDTVHYNQIKGKNMIGLFKDSQLSAIDVSGNGQTTYYAVDDLEKFIGVNVAESSLIKIRLKDRAINSISFLNKPKATMYPVNSLDPIEDLRYKGFDWRIKERPKKTDLN